jgi:hypothetical protein
MRIPLGLVVIILIMLFVVGDVELNEGRLTNSFAYWLDYQLYRVGLP